MPYTITLLTCDSQGKNEGTMVVSPETTLTEGYYYGFRFETTGEGVVLNDANTDVNATTSVTLPYQTTIYLEQSRTSGVDFKNTAVNAGKTETRGTRPPRMTWWRRNSATMALVI